MACVLYRPGAGTTNRGVKCESCRVDAKKVSQHLAAGWYASPLDFPPTKEEADTNNTGKLSSDEVRAAAKKAGIENWNTKRIKTLETELDY